MKEVFFQNNENDFLKVLFYIVKETVINEKCTVCNTIILNICSARN